MFGTKFIVSNEFSFLTLQNRAKTFSKLVSEIDGKIQEGQLLVDSVHERFIVEAEVLHFFLDFIPDVQLVVIQLLIDHVLNIVVPGGRCDQAVGSCQTCCRCRP